MKSVTIILPRWGVYLILVFVGTLTQAADGCFYNCCCSQGDTIYCNDAKFSPLPPLPDVYKKWCSAEKSPPEADKITTINLLNTSIDHISEDVFKACPNLKLLDISYCKFKVLGPDTLPVSGNTNLIEEINLKYNEIESIHEFAFKGIPRLKRLYLTGNLINSLPLDVFKSLPNLETLWLNNNKISDLQTRVFSPLRNLRDLDLSSNPLKNLQQFPPLRIITLKLINASIAELPQGVFSKLGSLEILDLSFNKMTNLKDGMFAQNHHLRQIYLNNNQLNVIGKEMFSYLCSLRLLDLRYNKLTIVHSQWFASIVGNSVERTTWKSELVIREEPANQGNPLDCDGEGVEIREYAFFLTRICNDQILKYIKLLEYLNIVCSSGRMLVDDKTCKTTARSLTTKEESTILSRNTEAKCMNGTETPECPFLSPVCANIKKNFALQKSEQRTSRSSFVMVPVAILITAVSVFLAYRVLRKQAEKRKRHASGSFEDSEALSINESESSLSITSETDVDIPQSALQEQRRQRHPPEDATPSFPLHNQHSPPGPGCQTALTPGVFCYHPSGIIDSFYPNPDSFSFPRSDTSRPAPLGSSQCNSTAPSITSRDMNDTGSLRSESSSAISSTHPKELVNLSIDTPNTVPKHVRESDGTQPKSLLGVEETLPKDHVNSDETIPKDLVNSDETILKDLVDSDETIPKEHSQSAETRPKNHPHLQSQPKARRAANPYVATPANHPQSDPTAIECHGYTTMSQQWPQNPPPPIPPRRFVATNQPGAQNSPNLTHSIPVQPPISQMPSCHQYCSIICQNPWPAPPPPNHRPPILPPPYFLTPDCYLRYPTNPLHLPHVVYPDTRPVRERPRSDQQPLLPDTEAQESEKKNKKKMKQKDKKKGPKRK